MSSPFSDFEQYMNVCCTYRILYGRMLRQGGHNTGKSGGASRRGIVLRFLAGCQGDEMKEFIKLLTLPFQGLTGNQPPAVEMVFTFIPVFFFRQVWS